eukprot:COSAG01_NODE_9049_length_2570_cov_1.932011_5_plen_31_part_01
MSTNYDVRVAVTPLARGSGGGGGTPPQATKK